MKNNVVATLARHQLKTFRVNYAPEYRNFIVNHVVVDFSHPLHETQKRRQAERKKEGLWWHATTGVDLNKSSCVRAWARRRLRNAIKDELKERGYDERGMFVDLQAIRDKPDLMNVLRAGKTLNLTGSLRLHVQPPLIPAKYAEVRKETGFVIEAVVQAMKDGAGGHASLKQMKKRPERNPSFSAKRSPPSRPRGHFSKQHVG